MSTLMSTSVLHSQCLGWAPLPSTVTSIPMCSLVWSWIVSPQIHAHTDPRSIRSLQRSLSQGHTGFMALTGEKVTRKNRRVHMTGHQRQRSHSSEPRDTQANRASGHWGKEVHLRFELVTCRTRRELCHLVTRYLSGCHSRKQTALSPRPRKAKDSFHHHKDGGQPRGSQVALGLPTVPWLQVSLGG